MSTATIKSLAGLLPAVSLCGTIVGATLWIVGRLDLLDRKIERQEQGDRAARIMWISEARRRNVTLDLPYFPGDDPGK
jgi:hypothetical protein